MRKNAGMYINKRQPTANKHVEMFVKLTCKLDTSGDVELSRPFAMSRRAFLEILNNLKLRKANGRNTMRKEMIKTTELEITTSLTEIIIKVIGTMHNIARSVRSLRLVSDVR